MCVCVFLVVLCLCVPGGTVCVSVCSWWYCVCVIAVVRCDGVCVCGRAGCVSMPRGRVCGGGAWGDVWEVVGEVEFRGLGVLWGCGWSVSVVLWVVWCVFFGGGVWCCVCAVVCVVSLVCSVWCRVCGVLCLVSLVSGVVSGVCSVWCL